MFCQLKKQLNFYLVFTVHFGVRAGGFLLVFNSVNSSLHILCMDIVIGVLWDLCYLT